MTVQNQTITAGEYTGNDVATTFSFPFRIENKNQVVVIQTDNTVTPSTQTVLTVDTDYTVGDIGQDDGGFVTLTTPLPTDNTLFMRSNFLPTQEVEFSNQGTFLPENHEFAYDKLTRLIQQLIYNGDLSLQFSNNTVINNFNPTLPTPDLPLGYLRINADGTALEWVLGSGLDTDASIDLTALTVNGGLTVINEENLYDQARPPVTNTTTAFSLDLTMQSSGVVTTNALAVTVTIEPNTTTAFPVGAVVPIYQNGEGQVEVVAGVGVSIETKLSEGNKISERYAFATAWQRATDVWVLSGSLTA